MLGIVMGWWKLRGLVLDGVWGMVIWTIVLWESASVVDVLVMDTGVWNRQNLALLRGIPC